MERLWSTSEFIPLFPSILLFLLVLFPVAVLCMCVHKRSLSISSNQFFFSHTYPVTLSSFSYNESPFPFLHWSHLDRQRSLPFTILLTSSSQQRVFSRICFLKCTEGIQTIYNVIFPWNVCCFLLFGAQHFRYFFFFLILNLFQTLEEWQELSHSFYPNYLTFKMSVHLFFFSLFQIEIFFWHDASWPLHKY